MIETNLSGIIIVDGHEYKDTPRMRNFIERGKLIREGLPPVPQGFTRLWRGNRTGEVGQNPSFTIALEGIALPFLDFYGGGKLSYVDIPTNDLPLYETSGSPGDEFILPTELATSARIIEEPKEKNNES